MALVAMMPSAFRSRLRVLAVYLACAAISAPLLTLTDPTRANAAGTITACFKRERDSGELRVPREDHHCVLDEVTLSWNKAGVGGPPGQRGQRGPQGVEGPEGVEGSPGVEGATGSADPHHRREAEGGGIVRIENSTWHEITNLFSVLAWPFVVGLLSSLILLSPQGRRFLADAGRRVKRISGGGFEIELSTESEKVKQDLEETIKSFRRQTILEFDRWATVEQVKERLERVSREVIIRALKPARGFQATVYVKDVLFRDVLYRLLNYYPGGGGRGKVYSIRFGIIGRTWRLRECQQEPVPANEGLLIERWGMTPEEAIQRGRSAKSFCCVPLMGADKSTEIGLLFVQSEAEDAFESDLCKRLEGSDALLSLAEAVEKVVRKLAEIAQPPITIFDE